LVAYVTRPWLEGANPDLGVRAPMQILRESDASALSVVQAADSFIG
jgi:hypothetical protein